MSASLLVASALIGIGGADATTLRGVELAPDHITFSFDRALDRASAFVLDKPQRIAVDLAGVDAGSPSADPAPGAKVTHMRVSHGQDQSTRVVFDLSTPAVVHSGTFSADGRALILAVATTDRQGFRAAARHAPQSWFMLASATPPTGGERSQVNLPLPAARAYAPARLPRIAGGGDRDRPLVVIDPGHGGHDPGSTSIYENRKEKDAALAIGKAVRDELLASGRVRVAMTRDDDRFVVLDERREIARRLHADLFISIHADSSPTSADAHGATVYTLSDVASDRVAARLAARENRADIINGVDLARQSTDVSSILIDLTQRESMNTAASFASLLQREMSPTVAFKSTFHRFAGLVVLKAPDVPSVLLETGYMSNMDDSKMLFSKEGQHKIAVGVAHAVLAHFARQMASN